MICCCYQVMNGFVKEGGNTAESEHVSVEIDGLVYLGGQISAMKRR
jgi:hypothetical protein